MTKQNPQGLEFTYRRSSNEVVIYYRSSRAATLRGRAASKFEREIGDLSLAQQQNLMARVTGNFKRGNERAARNHPRNSRKPA